MIRHIGNIECLTIWGKSELSWGVETGSNTVTFNKSGGSVSGYERSGIGCEIDFTDTIIGIICNIEKIIGFVEGETVWGVETSGSSRSSFDISSGCTTYTGDCGKNSACIHLTDTMTGSICNIEDTRSASDYILSSSKLRSCRNLSSISGITSGSITTKKCRLSKRPRRCRGPYHCYKNTENKSENSLKKMVFILVFHMEFGVKK